MPLYVPARRGRSGDSGVGDDNGLLLPPLMLVDLYLAAALCGTELYVTAVRHCTPSYLAAAICVSSGRLTAFASLPRRARIGSEQYSSEGEDQMPSDRRAGLMGSGRTAEDRVGLSAAERVGTTPADRAGLLAAAEGLPFGASPSGMLEGPAVLLTRGESGGLSSRVESIAPIRVASSMSQLPLRLPSGPDKAVAPGGTLGP